MPSADRYLRSDGLPTINSVKFRASALNQIEFRNFFEVIKNNQIWVAMRLHELIHLQLQFYPQYKHQELPLNPETGLPKQITFIQNTHTQQKVLDSLLAKIKLKFWLPLQQIRKETIYGK